MGKNGYNTPMKYLIFDLDGTLTQPYEGITKSIIHALKTCGKEEPPEELLRECIGPPLEYSFSHIFGMNREETAVAVKAYRERYRKVCAEENALMPYVKEGLRRLSERGYIMAIATGKPTVFAEEIVKKFEIAEYFVALSGSGLDGSNSTKREEILGALEAVGEVSMGECCMIGDRKYDIEGGRSLGMHTAGLRFGYAAEGELEAAGAEMIFDDFEKLVYFFDKLKN